MENLLLILWIIGVGFVFFMMTPFGVCWVIHDLDNGKPCYGVIIFFLIVIPLLVITKILGIE